MSALGGSGRVHPEKTIGGYLYRCVPLRGEDVLDVIVMVCRAVAPAAEGADELVGSMLSGQPVNRAAFESSIGGGLPAVLRNLRAEDVQDLRKRLARVTEVERDGRWMPLADIFGEHFKGAPAEILQWMLHAFTVSFPLFSLASAPSPDPASR